MLQTLIVNFIAICKCVAVFDGSFLDKIKLSKCKIASSKMLFEKPSVFSVKNFEWICWLTCLQVSMEDVKVSVQVKNILFYFQVHYFSHRKQQSASAIVLKNLFVFRVEVNQYFTKCFLKVSVSDQ